MYIDNRIVIVIMPNMLSRAQAKMLKLNYNAVLNSRVLLYFILFLSVADLTFFSMVGDYISILVFFIVGGLTAFFSKNMMVIFTVAMVFTNILKFGRHSAIEGMENETGTGTAAPAPKVTDPNDPAQKELNAELAKEIADENFEDADVDTYLKNEDNKDLTLKANNAKGLNPSKILPDVKSVANEDPAVSVAGLDEQTQNLLEKQKILLKNMDSLDPLLKKAEAFMSKFDSLNSTGTVPSSMK